MQTIGVDCRLAGIAHAGIGRYVENIVRRLPEARPNTSWVYFFSSTAQAKQVLSGVSSPRVRCVIAPIRHYSLAEQVVWPLMLLRQRIDVLHVPHFNIPILYPGKILVTIHDLLWHEYKGQGMTTLPWWQYEIKHWLYRCVAFCAVSRAQVILVPAETIRKTVIRLFPQVRKKIVVTTEGADERLQASGEQPWPQPPILLYVGSLYPHKNISLVLAALAKLPTYQLWMVGTRSVFQDRVKAQVAQMGLEKQVQFLGYQSDRDLGETLRQVQALIQPSLSEGFGLTGLEAMALGVPVVASAIPIFQEVYQDGVEYFDPKSAESLVQAVARVSRLSASHLRARQRKAQRIVSLYSWDATTAKTVAAYDRVIGPADAVAV